jgi:chemotaxis protein methyltransferase CheR
VAFTYFFRDHECLTPAVDHLAVAVLGRQRIRVWDAGCADGPEPYTLAILLAERLGRFQFRNVRIDATDVDESGHSSQAIACGSYPRADLERVPHALRDHYFHPESPEPPESAGCGARMRVVEELRSQVTFRRHDLLSLQPPRSDYQLVVCKNVLLHFTAEQRVQVLTMFHAALERGGILVMEQTQPLPPACEPLFARIAQAASIYSRLGA